MFKIQKKEIVAKLIALSMLIIIVFALSCPKIDVSAYSTDSQSNAKQELALDFIFETARQEELSLTDFEYTMEDIYFSNEQKRTRISN